MSDSAATAMKKLADIADQFDDADDEKDCQNVGSGNLENRADVIPASNSTRGADNDLIPTTGQVAVPASTTSVDKEDEAVEDKEKKPAGSVKAEFRKPEAKATAAADIFPASETSDVMVRAKGEDNEKNPPDSVNTEAGKTDTKASTPPDSPGKAQESGPATPVPKADTKPLSTSSPLDALASIACVAEERRQIKESALGPPGKLPKTPKEGTRVNADEICCTDVLCGRGGQSNHHPGNIFFRRLVRAKQEEYLRANKREKTVVAKDIVKLIRLLSPPGRFLKKDPKNEAVYVDVGDIQARNKASQALREGAPELREELRDQHSRMNAGRGGGPQMKLPYHGSGGTAAASTETAKTENDQGGAGREAAVAATHGMYLPAFAAADARAAASLRARGEGKVDPPEEEADEGSERAEGAAATVHASAEARARRVMMASMGQPGLGSHFLHPHFGMGGFGAGAMNPFLAGPSPAQLAAFGGAHMLSPQAMMFAAHQQPSAAALFQASRARGLANQIEAANYAAASGMNPLFLGEQRGAAHFHDSMRLHDMVKPSSANSDGSAKKASGEVGNKVKRSREEGEREFDETYAKAAKLSRQYL